MKILEFKISFIVASIITAFVIYQGIFYRWVGYETKPVGMLDEVDYTWQGLSLKTTGIPLAWSTFPDNYKNRDYGFEKGKIVGFGVKTDNQTINVSEFRDNSKPVIAIEEIDFGEGAKQLSFVAPFFDRPPLGGLVYSVGIDSKLQNFSDVKTADYRKMSLVLGLIVSFLIFILALLVSNNPWTGVLSVIIYNTVPTYVFASRYALGENVVVPFVLMQLILLAIFKSAQSSKNLITFPTIILSGFMGGLAILAKESAAGFFIGSAVLLLYWKVPKKIFLLFCIGFIFPIIAYLAWGFWLQGDLFLHIFLSNMGRPFFGSLKFIMTLQSLRFQDFPIDGWWIWGFISIFITCYCYGKKYLLLILPTLIHLALIIFMGGENYPWYYLALIPFFAIYSAIVIWNSIKIPNVSILLTFFLLAVSSSFYWGYSVLHKVGDGTGYKLLFVLFVSLLFVRIYFSKYKFVYILWYVFFIVLLYQVMKWNNYSILYMIEHWGKLPISSLPKM